MSKIGTTINFKKLMLLKLALGGLIPFINSWCIKLLITIMNYL